MPGACTSLPDDGHLAENDIVREHRSGTGNPRRSNQDQNGIELRRHRSPVHGVMFTSIEAAPSNTSHVAPSTGTDVVMVHGLAMSNRYFKPCMNGLATQRRVVAPQLAGAGRRTRPSRPLTTPELAEGLAEWMEAVGMGRAVVIGHSLGSRVVTHLAVRHPARVAAVVLISPVGDPRHPAWWRSAWRLLRDAPREKSSLMPIAIGDYLRMGPIRTVRRLKDARRMDARPTLCRISQHTLVVRGERDPLVSRDWAEELTTLLPAGELVTIAGAPHAVHYSAADDFVAAVLRFLTRIGV